MHGTENILTYDLILHLYCADAIFAIYYAALICACIVVVALQVLNNRLSNL